MRVYMCVSVPYEFVQKSLLHPLAQKMHPVGAYIPSWVVWTSWDRNYRPRTHEYVVAKDLSSVSSYYLTVCS